VAKNVGSKVYDYAGRNILIVRAHMIIPGHAREEAKEIYIRLMGEPSASNGQEKMNSWRRTHVSFRKRIISTKLACTRLSTNQMLRLSALHVPRMLGMGLCSLFP